MEDKPLTIENRWDILYRDYPEAYDEFVSVPKNPDAMEVINEKFHLDGKVVVDVGSGTGLSSFDLAKYAIRVVGVEPEAAMRKVAEENARQRGIKNVQFLEGRAEDIPVDDDSADVVTAFTAKFHPPKEAVRKFVEEATRVAKPGGTIIVIDIPPGWYGGELASIIGGEKHDQLHEQIHQAFVDEAGFSFEDFDHVQEYGSLDKIISTYGFIFGKKAIEYLQKHKKTSITWRSRIYSKQM